MIRRLSTLTQERRLRRRYISILMLVFTAGLSSFLAAQPVAVDIPPRPEEIRYGELNFTVPDGDDYRHELSNGTVVYVAEDHTLPLVSIRIILKVGSHLDPPDKVGLSGLVGTMMREGGTKSLSPHEFNEKVEFLAAQMSSFGSDTQAGANLSTITPVLEESLVLFFEMLREPGFDEGRLEIEKGNILEAMKQRNDAPDSILRREWDWIFFGEDHFSSRRMTEANLNNITRADLEAFHDKYWRPQNMLIVASGDVDTDEILQELEERLAKWTGTGADAEWPPPQPTHQVEPGLYHVEKDIPQGRVRIGHLVPQWTDWTNPDRAVIQVMDEILGAGGFTSRILQRIRSDEGLAYSAGARFGFDALEPGRFTIFYQSKSPTVALAAQIALEEVRRIQNEPVSDEELALAKNSLVEAFPRRFESARRITGIFATDEFMGRSHDYWTRWREQVSNVTAEDVQRIAQKYLDPENVVFLVVGKWEDIEPGDADDRASMKEFFGGQVTHLPLRDPLTLEKQQ